MGNKKIYPSAKNLIKNGLVQLFIVAVQIVQNDDKIKLRDAVGNFLKSPLVQVKEAAKIKKMFFLNGSAIKASHPPLKKELFPQPDKTVVDFH